MTAIKDLILAWSGALSMRQALTHQRSVLGIEHARFNREVMVLEDKLIAEFGGTEHFIPDGRLLTIGKPGCRLADRMKLTGVSTQEPQVIAPLPYWSDCEAKVEAGTANPIERFIYDYEPMDGQSMGQEFRRDLALALGYAHTNFLT